MTVIVGTTLRSDDAPLVELAALLAARLKAPLRLVHVCEDPRAPTPSEQLLSLCERVGANLLVLGARKRTAVGRVLTGSLARAAIEDPRFPVLVVPARSP